MNDDMPPPVSRQEIAADLLSASIVNGSPITKEKAVLGAGYAVSTSRRTQQVTKSDAFRRRVELWNKRMSNKLGLHADAILAAMAAKRKAAGYRDLTYSFDIVKKHKALADGTATENLDVHGSVVFLPTDKSNLESENGA